MFIKECYSKGLSTITNHSFLVFILRSPSIMGILVAERKFFGEIGGLDGGMKIYGGENVELGIRVKSQM